MLVAEFSGSSLLNKVPLGENKRSFHSIFIWQCFFPDSKFLFTEVIGPTKSKQANVIVSRWVLKHSTITMSKFPDISSSKGIYRSPSTMIMRPKIKDLC